MGLFGKKEDIHDRLRQFANTEGAILIDVRLKEDYKAGHIPRARNIPYNHIKNYLNLITDKDTPLFLYDDDDMLAKKTMKQLKHNGYTNITVIGSISDGYRGGFV